MTTQASAPTIAVRGLSFAYTEQTVFEGFAWTTSHRLNLLLGPSGCGKTTLLRILAGHLAPGRVEELQTPGRGGLILQDDGLFPWLTVRQNLDLLPIELRRQDAERTLLNPLRDVVAPYEDKLVGRLSFGERRTVELLRMLSGDFPFILLDEPLNFLDKAKRTAAVNCMRAVANKGTVFVVSTHYASDFDGVGFTSFTFTRDAPHRELRGCAL